MRKTPWWNEELLGPIRVWHLAIALLLSGGSVKCVCWLSTPRTVSARVVTISWTYTRNLRNREVRSDSEWGRPGRKGFYNEPAFNVHCNRRYYGQEDCSPHPCPSDPHSTCWYSCPEFRDWCSYDYWEWPIARTEQFGGDKHDAAWPPADIQLTSTQRFQLIEQYAVSFQSKDEKLTYYPDEVWDYNRFDVGDYWTLGIRHVTGSIVSLEKQVAEKE